MSSQHPKATMELPSPIQTAPVCSACGYDQQDGDHSPDCDTDWNSSDFFDTCSEGSETPARAGPLTLVSRVGHHTPEHDPIQEESDLWCPSCQCIHPDGNIFESWEEEEGGQSNHLIEEIDFWCSGCQCYHPEGTLPQGSWEMLEDEDQFDEYFDAEEGGDSWCSDCHCFHPAFTVPWDLYEQPVDDQDDDFVTATMNAIIRSMPGILHPDEELEVVILAVLILLLCLG